MEFYSRNGQTFGNSENNLNVYETFQNASVRSIYVIPISTNKYKSEYFNILLDFFLQIWNLTEKDCRSNYYATHPTVTRFDLNNNDDAHPTFQPKMSSTMLNHRKNYFDLNNQSSLNVRTKL